MSEASETLPSLLETLPSDDTDLSPGETPRVAPASAQPPPEPAPFEPAPAKAPEPPQTTTAPWVGRFPPGCTLAAGTAFEHYEIIRQLGQGGMGQVYLARDTKLGRLVAIKLLSERGERGAQRLLVEARATARCKHENIVVVHEVDEYQGAPYMVLEYIEGSTLRAWLDRRTAAPEGVSPEAAAAVPKPVPPALALELMVPVVRALACAHEQGIVHRDLKPENVLLSDAGHVKVVDFGIATQAEVGVMRRAEGEGPRERESPLGTYLYMAPEQWRCEAVDARADVWAAGVMLYELCAGIHPLAPPGRGRLALVADPLTAMPSLRAARPDLGPLAAVVDRCLAKRKEARFRTPRELLAELEPLLADGKALALGKKDASPFTGLSAFQEEDAPRFFGRDADVARTLRLLRTQPLLSVVGASGAGKSSFVRAGVIPALKRSGERWQAFVVRPGRRPLAALADVLAQLAGPPESRGRGALAAGGLADTVTTLREEPGHFGAQLRKHCRRHGGRALLFVDQFEELYTLGVDADERSAFQACLEGAADDASSPLRVALSLRSDFLDRMVDEGNFLVDVTRGLVLLSPLGGTGLREALTRPLDAVGYRFESEALVERMTRSLAGTRSPLPLLQFTADRLWGERDREKRLLTEASYERIGGVEGALAAHADATVAAMSSREQGLCREVLLRLITPERTRAVVGIGELRALASGGPGGKDTGSIERVVRLLVDARLLSFETEGEHDDQTLELVHESLIERWPKLRQWLDEGEQDAHFLARLRAAAAQWGAGGQAEGLLWRDRAAREARAWLEQRRAEGGGEVRGVGEREERFLRALTDFHDRSQRLRRKAAAGLVAALTAVALSVSYLALRARTEAERAQAEAVRTRNATRMATAREKQADPTTVLSLLRELEPPDLPRGWAAMADWALRRGVAQTLLTHPDVVYSAAFSPDGKRVASASSDKLVRIWNADGSGEPLVLRGHEGWVFHVAFGPDGKHVASASMDHTVRVWSVDRPADPVVLRGHDGSVHGVAFSPDGRQIVSTSGDKTVRIWSADGSGQPLVLRGHEGLIYGGAFSPDGKHVASASYDRTVRVWNADGSGEPVVLRGHEGFVYAAAFSPDSKRVVSASFDKTLRIWNADGSGEPRTLGRHDEFIDAAAFSPDGRRVVSASGDRTVRVWDADGASEPIVLRGHEGFAHSAAFSPDGRQIVSASSDGTVRVWRAEGKRYPKALRGHQHEVRRVAWSADGRRIATGSFDGSARVFQADGSGEPIVLRGHTLVLTALALSPDGRRVATGSADKTLRVWTESAPGEPLTLRGHQDHVTSVAFSPDGRRLASASWDKTLRIWAADGTGEPLVLRGHDEIVTSVAFSPDGRRLVSGSYDKTARIWNADGTGEPIVLRGHDDNLTSVAFSPDGRLVATGSHDRTVRVWRADGAGEPVVLRGHEHWVHAVAFSPDGRLVASASQDGTVRLFQADGSGEPSILRHDAPVNAVAFSPDGKHLVSGADDNAAWVWSDLEPLHDFKDPELWAATTYCLPASRRVALLSVPEAQARADEAACRRHAAAPQAAPR